MSKNENVDHKVLGRELDLYVFSDLVGSGLPLFTPKGTIIRDELEQFVLALQEPHGYERVRIPHITKKELYQVSGHWDKFKDELFRIKSREGDEFALKPMNCPHHTQIYASRPRSYRELPLRFAEVTMVYRDEQSGELQGLARVRAITQDDAHVFCRVSQVEEEVLKIWQIVDEFYKPFGMPLAIRLSRHDPKKMKQYLGTPEIWQEAESKLKTILDKKKVKYLDALGEAAMYGPKIDFIATDSLGREWQLATIQLDFNMPERFDLTCVDERGGNERIVMIHRAVLGAIERFMAILIEHYAGAFPLWLSPVQVVVLPIGEAHQAYAMEVYKKLKEHKIRVELNAASETLGKRIREAETAKTPYILVLGDKEAKAKSVAVRKRGQGDLGLKKLSSLLDEIKREIELKK